jgi:hypothetical protein
LKIDVRKKDKLNDDLLAILRLIHMEFHSKKKPSNIFIKINAKHTSEFRISGFAPAFRRISIASLFDPITA